jgi:hypothetical protein
MVECLTDGPFASSSIKKCEYIRIIIQICEEFEKDLALGLFDLLKNAVEAINGFDRNQNRHTDAELNSVSIRLFQWRNQGGANGQLPISFEDLPIAIFISKFLPIAIFISQFLSIAIFTSKFLSIAIFISKFLSIVIFISKFLPIEILLFQNCLFMFELYPIEN